MATAKLNYLTKQAMSIPLTGGIDRKTDKHQLASGQMYTADNVQYISQKQLMKRFGCQAISPPGGLQGAPFTAIGTRDNVEPVIQGGNALNRLDVATGLSTYIAAPTQGRIDSIAVASSTGNTATAVVPSNPSCASDGQKYVCVAWEEPQAFNATSVIYYGVQDLATGNWIISPRTIGPQTTPTATLAAPRVVYAFGSFYVFFIETSGASQYINNVSMSTSNLQAMVSQNTSGSITVQNGTGTSTNLYGWAYDVVVGYTDANVNYGIVVGWMDPSGLAQANTTTSAKMRIAVYTNGNAVVPPAYTSLTTGLASTGATQKIALTFNASTIFGVTNGSIASFTGKNFATTIATLVNQNYILPTSNGVVTMTGYTPRNVATFVRNNILYYLATVTAGAGSTIGTNVVTPTHNLLFQFPLSGNVVGTSISTSTFDPPNNTTFTSILSKPFFNTLTGNLYVWIGAGGYADATSYSNCFLVEVANYGTAGNAIARCLYGETANIGAISGQNGPCEVLKALTKSRYITYISTQTTTATYQTITGNIQTPQGTPTSFYGNLNLTGFDFNPPRGNQLLQIPQGGLLSTSALPWAYDGQQVSECGFSAAPAVKNGIGVITITTGTGFPAAGTYWYTLCFVRRDAYGNITRSAPSTPFQIALSGSNTVQFNPQTYAGNNVFVEYYRSISTTATSAAAPGVYYLIGTTPQATYFVDRGGYSDTTIQYQPTIYTASGEIENDPPPPIHHMAFGESRAFIIPSDARNQIWYSKPYFPGKQLEWSANFTVNEGANAGLFTAVAVLDTNVICFKADSIAYFSGTGPDATGANGSFSSFARLSSDVGCIDPGSLAIVPNGLLFRSRRGIELLSRGLSVSYVGFPVEPLVQSITTITSAVVMPTYMQVRFVPSIAGQPVLVYDYAYNRWSTYSGMASVQANCLTGQYWWISADGMTVLQETPGQFTDNGANIVMTLETPELPLAGIQGWGRAYRMAVLGDFKSSHTMFVSFAYDHSPIYQDQVGYSIATQSDIDTVVSGLVGVSQVGWDLENPGSANPYEPYMPGDYLGRAPTVVTPPCAEQFRLSRMPRQRMQACRIMLQDGPILASFRNDGTYQTTPLAFGESCAISDITIEFGQKANMAKLGPSGTV